MGAVLRVYAIDLERFRAMLGSGEEAFCAKVLRGIPDAAERRGLAKNPELVKEWKRAVTGLVLGAAGEAMSSRLPFEKVDRAGPALSLAFASLLEGFSPEGLEGTLPITGSLRPELLQRPLFGLEADGELVRWGCLHKDELTLIASHPLASPIRMRGLSMVGLSGSSWTD